MTKKAKPPGKIKAAILDWLGVPDSSYWTAVGTTKAGQSVNETTILSISAVWACVRLISETISTLPFSVYERKNGQRIAAKEHPLHNIINSYPNTDVTAAVFWESFIASMLIHGNGFAEKMMIGNRLVGLNFLYPRALTVQKRNNSTVYLYTENGKQREIPANRIFRIPGFSLNGNWGVSAIEYGASMFGSALAANDAANNTFENGLSPTAVYKIERILTPTQRETFRESVDAISGAVNAGKSPVLEGGMDVKTIGINPKDAQLLESKGFSVEEICRWFRVPPNMVGHSGQVSQWGTGIEQIMIGFLTFTLRPWLTRIEQYVTKDLLTPAERSRYFAEFTVEGLLRGDSKARSEFYASALRNGWMNRSQVADKENVERPEGGDIYTVTSDLIKLDDVGSNML